MMADASGAMPICIVQYAKVKLFRGISFVFLFWFFFYLVFLVVLGMVLVLFWCFISPFLFRSSVHSECYQCNQDNDGS
jgi:hypothetical protein